MSRENVEIVRRFIALGDVRAEELTNDVLKEFFDPEVEWVTLPQGVLAGNEYRGYAGIRRFWTDFFATWDELLVEPQEFRGAGDQVVTVLRMRGRMHELEIDEIWSALFTLSDGRISRVQSFASPEGALEAAGLRE